MFMAWRIPAIAGPGTVGWPPWSFGAAASGGEPASCSHTVAICAHMAGNLVSGGQARSGWASSRKRSRVDPDRPAQITNTGSALGPAASGWTVWAAAGPGLGACPRDGSSMEVCSWAGRAGAGWSMAGWSMDDGTRAGGIWAGGPLACGPARTGVALAGEAVAGTGSGPLLAGTGSGPLRAGTLGPELGGCP